MGSYSSAEMQSVYSAAQADWTKKPLVNKRVLKCSCAMHLVIRYIVLGVLGKFIYFIIHLLLNFNWYCSSKGMVLA